MLAKPEPSFSMGDLLAEMEAMLAPSGGGARTAELAEAIGVCESSVRKLLRQLKSEGRLAVVRQKVEGLDGRMFTVAAYRLREVK